MSQINKPCWILTFPKCGSTYLCGLLNSTGFFDPPFKEWYNPQNGEPERPPLFNKLFPPYHQLRGISIHQYHDDMHYVLYQRRDIVSWTIATYFRQVTDIHNLKNPDALEDYADLKVKYCRSLLRRIYERRVRNYHFWSRFVKGKKFIQVFYEDVNADPTKEVGRILDFLGHQGTWSIDTGQTVQKLYHPKKEPYAERLARYLTGLDYLASE